MKKNIHRRINSLNRYQEILRVFIKYGFDDIVNKISTAKRIQINKNPVSKQDQNINALTTPERLRMAFEELGVTFI